AEISNFTKKEHEEYERSLKAYRDLQNTIDYKYNIGRKEGRKEEKNLVAIVMIENNEPNTKIIKYTNLSIKEIEELRIEIKNHET
ncbi:MAG: hypothetical protein U9R19_12675, partial [Bacteroidota bacterium]|nr:hypothetical protein [Bacteroidota bacterium]